MSWDVSNGLKLTLQGDTDWGPCPLPNWFQTRQPQRQTLSIKYFSFLTPNEGTICQEQATTFSCRAAPELPSANTGLARGAWPLSLAGKDEDSNPNQRDDLCAGQHSQAKAQLCQDEHVAGISKGQRKESLPAPAVVVCKKVKGIQFYSSTNPSRKVLKSLEPEAKSKLLSLSFSSPFFSLKKELQHKAKGVLQKQFSSFRPFPTQMYTPLSIETYFFSVTSIIVSFSYEKC